MRQIDDRKILIASHNSGKVSEINNLLLELGLEPCSAIDLGLIEPEETGQTFVENSELKASAASKASGLMALADDSGLVVPTLGGPRAYIQPAGQLTIREKIAGLLMQ